MKIAYSGKSMPSALKIAEASDGEIVAVRSSDALVNWGRSRANTKLNPDISNATNKRRMRELFKEHGVPMPELYDSESHWKFPVIGRPDTHSKGRGYWKCYNWLQVQKAMKGTRKKKGATHFMEFVEAPREYRVHIFLGKSIRISEKAHTAFHEYTTIKPTHNVDHVRKSAKQAVKALGLDFGAVDILADDTQSWVLEVNCAPGVGGSMPKLYADKFKQWEEDNE